MTEAEEFELVRRRLRRGPRPKYVFVKHSQLCIIREGADLVEIWLHKSNWSLAGVFRPGANVQDVMEAIACTRLEQRQNRSAGHRPDARPDHRCR